MQKTYEEIAKKISEEFELFRGKRSDSEDQAIFDMIIAKINERLIEKAIDEMTDSQAKGFEEFLNSDDLKILCEEERAQRAVTELINNMDDSAKLSMVAEAYEVIEQIKALSAKQ